MTLRVSGKNLDIGESLRQHVLEKVDGMVARYFTGTVSGHVVIAREGSGYRSDCTLRLSSGVSLHAEGSAHEPYPCFEHAADKIEARLRRYKQRLKGRPGGVEAPAPAARPGYGFQLPRRDADRRGRTRRGLQAGGRRRGDGGAKVHVRRFGGRRTGPHRRAGGRVRPRDQRTGEYRLSADGTEQSVGSIHADGDFSSRGQGRPP